MTKDELRTVALSKIGVDSKNRNNSNLIIINNSHEGEHYKTSIKHDLEDAMLKAVDLLYEEDKFVDSINNMDTLISINFVDSETFSNIKGSKQKVTKFDEINVELEEEKRKNSEINLEDSFELWGYASNYGEFDELPDTEKCSRIYLCIETIIEASKRFEKNINQYRYKEKLGKIFNFEVSSSFFSDPENLMKIVLYHELGHCVAGHNCEDGYTLDYEREAQFYCSIFFNSHIWSIYILYLSLFQPLEYQQRFLLYIDDRHGHNFSPNIFTQTYYSHESTGAIYKYFNLEKIYDKTLQYWKTNGSKYYTDYESEMGRDLLDIIWVDLNKHLR